MIDRESNPPPADPRRRKARALAAASLVALVVFAVLGLLLGSADLSVRDVLEILAHRLGLGSFTGTPLTAIDPIDDAIVWSLRLPRVLLALLVGAALGVAGALMQGLFRNALASPGICGTSSGASLGAVIALATGWANQSLLVVPALAVLGALGALIVVVRLASRHGEVHVATLLLAGVALNSLLAALDAWIISLSWNDYDAARRIAYWALGGLTDRGYLHLFIALPGILVAGLIAARSATELDLLAEGDEVAATLGVDLRRAKRRALGASALLVGSAVAVAGVVTFVGLIVPHIVRLVAGPGHRKLVPLSALVGAVFLLGADLAARVLARPAELHLGVVTAFCGAPFFLFLLVRHRREVEAL